MGLFDKTSEQKKIARLEKDIKAEEKSLEMHTQLYRDTHAQVSKKTDSLSSMPGAENNLSIVASNISADNIKSQQDNLIRRKKENQRDIKVFEKTIKDADPQTQKPLIQNANAQIKNATKSLQNIEALSYALDELASGYVQENTLSVGIRKLSSSIIEKKAEVAKLKGISNPGQANAATAPPPPVSANRANNTAAIATPGPVTTAVAVAVKKESKVTLGDI